MKTIIARHKVGDINTWLNGHAERVELFKQASSTLRTFQDADDPNSVLLLIDTDDFDKLVTLVNDPAYDEVKARHTVIPPITISTETDI